jgi:hypothetical protein
MRGNQSVAGRRVGRCKNVTDPFERHLKLPEAADYLCCGDLVRRVAPVAGVRVDGGRLKQPDLVVVAEHLHAHQRRAREAAD